MLASLRMVHVDLARLKQVAETDEAVFTAEEYEHLKNCSSCYAIWTKYIQDGDGQRKPAASD